MAQKTVKKLLLSLSIATALGCGWSGSVLADGSEIEALEQRIAELEALVHLLMQNKPAPAPAAAASTADIEATAEKAAEAKVVALIEEHEAAVAEETHKHSYKFGGYIKTDVMYSDYSSGSYSGAGRSSSSGRPSSSPSSAPGCSAAVALADFHMVTGWLRSRRYSGPRICW